MLLNSSIYYFEFKINFIFAKECNSIYIIILYQIIIIRRYNPHVSSRAVLLIIDRFESMLFLSIAKQVLMRKQYFVFSISIIYI
jgi:hypothetical protein